MSTERDGWLQLDGWAGRTQQLVRVVGETPKRWRIRAICRTKLGGRCRWIYAGERALVPRHTITDEPIAGVGIVWGAE